MRVRGNEDGKGRGREEGSTAEVRKRERGRAKQATSKGGRRGEGEGRALPKQAKSRRIHNPRRCTNTGEFSGFQSKKISDPSGRAVDPKLYIKFGTDLA